MRAKLDERLTVTIVSERLLRYTRPAHPDDDRPAHVRAASGLAVLDGKLFVIQDDANFIAVVDGDEVEAIALPRGPGGRRQFESALGNKLDKLDLEACIADAGELIAFGSGSIPIVREQICRVGGDREVVIASASELYGNVRAAIGGVLNVEGAAHVGGELWLFHRGNTGPSDPGPAIARVSFAEFRAFLDGAPAPAIRGVDRYDLGTTIDGVRFGFTDAATCGDRVFVVCAAEASRDAIEDGVVGGSRIGVLDRELVRYAPLVGTDGRPRKVEGLAFEGRDRAWITVDSDDPHAPAPLCEVSFEGPWW